jgi:phage regulator Rha-like protein
MVTIEKMSCSDDFRGRNFSASSYVSSQNKTLPSYEMTKDGFCFLCMGFTGDKAAQFKEAYIEAYNQMELSIATYSLRAPKSMEELNVVSKQIEELKEVGSFHGKGLASYKKKKIKIDETFKIALDTAQLVLNIK